MSRVGQSLMRGAAAVQNYSDESVANTAPPDDLSRDVHVVLGVPIDPVDMATTMQRIDAAAQHGTRFLISTVNSNFLVASKTNAEFKESLYRSDLCTADGMPVV